MQSSNSQPFRSWHRVKLRVSRDTAKLNGRIVGFDLRAILKSVWKEGFTFHPLDGPLPLRLQLGESREIWWLLATDDPARVADAVRALLEYPARNYRIAALGEPESRSLSLLHEAHSLPDTTELCLRFLTGFEFMPEDTLRPWMLSGEKLSALLAATAERVLGCELPIPAHIETLPWFWTRGKPHSRPSKSQPGHRETLGGCRGPLLIRGDLAALWPALLLAREWHLGRGIGKGQGHFEILAEPPILDSRLADPAIWEAARLDLLSRPQTPAPAWRNLDEATTRSVAEHTLSARYEPASARQLTTDSGRIVAELSPQDRLVHTVLHRILTPVAEKLLHDSALAFRPGRGVAEARSHFETAIEQGFTHGIRCDVASFFDEIPWDNLLRALDCILPRGDTATRAALEKIIRAPWQSPHPARTAGILQGSAVSPLLSNLYLAEWDAALAARGYRHVRFCDDLLLFATSENEARSMLADAAGLLTPLGLRLREEKTRIAPLAEGIRYLGLELELFEPGGASTSTGPVRRPLILTGADQWAGLEERALTLRSGGELLRRIGLERVSEIHACGIGGFSTGLLRACFDRAIPVVISDSSGRSPQTFVAHGATAWETLRRHCVRHSALDEDARLAAARLVLRAKIDGYLGWFSAVRDREAKQISRELRERLDSVEKAASIEILFGIEGASAARVYRWLHTPPRLRDEAWFSARREPRARLDRWNLITDTLSHLLFHRISARIRAAGLDPFLGFLHSPTARFESLTCDLQEPFRARLDRLALRLANLRTLRPEDFVQNDDATFSFAPGVWPRIVRALEEELDTIRPPDTLTWRDLIAITVLRIADWAKGMPDLKIGH